MSPAYFHRTDCTHEGSTKTKQLTAAICRRKESCFIEHRQLTARARVPDNAQMRETEREEKRDEREKYLQGRGIKTDDALKRE